MTEKKHKHNWEPHPELPKKAVCETCGKVDYRSNLSKAWRAKVAEMDTVAKKEEVTVVTKTVEETPEEEPKLEVKAVDLLMWVGNKFYPSPNDFLQEARTMGACKRVPMLPRAVVAGESRVFLAHDEAITSELLAHDEDVADEEGSGGSPGIFAYFVVNGITFITTPGTNIPEELKKRGITEWEYKEGGFGFADERGCGSLAIGGTYLLSEKDMQKAGNLAKSVDVAGQIVELDEPIPLKQKRIRGYKHISGEEVLSGAAEKHWYDDAHRVYLENKKAMRRYKRKLRRLKKKRKEKKA